jgi:voltage-dependent calcium channel T type alpha-1G
VTKREYSLYIFSKENPFRIRCRYITTQKWFDYTILFFIALNCITLAMERPNIPPHSTERKILTNSNYLFSLIFTLEMIVKILANGFYIGEDAYLNSGWNKMDGFLVGISLVDAIVTMTARSSPKIFGILRVFRLLRTLRPLRVISRAPGLKLVVQTLLTSLRPIGNIVLICCTFFIIFGILGVQVKFLYIISTHIKLSKFF